MTEYSEEKLLELIQVQTYRENDRIKFKCPDALKLAAELGIDPLKIAAVCNRHDIRIAACQLGCFK